jgi:hypothetical protein
MARDTPMNDDEHAALREEMQRQAAELRQALADDLGGDPDDYRVGEQPVADGGE